MFQISAIIFTVLGLRENDFSPGVSSQSLNSDQSLSIGGLAGHSRRQKSFSRSPSTNSHLIRKHGARYGLAHRCEVEDCAHGFSGFTTVNDLHWHELNVHRILYHSTHVYRCFGIGCSDSEKEWPPNDNFKSHLRKYHPDEDEEGHLTKSVTWVNNQHRASACEDILTSTMPSIMNKQIKLKVLWQRSLRENPDVHRLGCTIGFDTLSGRVMSYPQEMEVSAIGDGTPWDAADTADFAKCRPLERSEHLVRQKELTVVFIGETWADKSALINAFVKPLSLPPLDSAMCGEAPSFNVPRISRSLSVPVNIRKGHGAFDNDTWHMRTSSTSMPYLLRDGLLLPATEHHAKRTDPEDVAAPKPQPLPARMSPDDDDNDESYGFRRARSRLAYRQNEEWRAVIARVCDPFSRAKEHEIDKLCRVRSTSVGKAMRMYSSAGRKAIETY